MFIMYCTSAGLLKTPVFIEIVKLKKSSLIQILNCIMTLIPGPPLGGHPDVIDICHYYRV